jgi:hypothetical protein
MKPHFLLSHNDIVLRIYGPCLMDMAEGSIRLLINGKSTGKNAAEIFWLITADSYKNLTSEIKCKRG